MANKRVDLAGKTINSISVLEFAGVSGGATLWKCRCNRCGREFTIEGYRLTSKTRPRKDCGCSHTERRADLTGKTFGALEVLRADGVGPHGDRMYVCCCELCGQEKVFPACTIRCNPKSCGCMKHDSEAAKALAAFAVKKNVVDGVQVYAATRSEPNANNGNGYRWVRVLHRQSGDFIFAAFYVRGRRYYRGGFESTYSAHLWAETEHERVLLAEGIEDPRIPAKNNTQEEST